MNNRDGHPCLLADVAPGVCDWQHFTGRVFITHMGAAQRIHDDQRRVPAVDRPKQASNGITISQIKWSECVDAQPSIQQTRVKPKPTCETPDSPTSLSHRVLAR